MELLELLFVVSLTGSLEDLAVRFQYTAEFLCNLVDWYL